jgi:arylsulfatase A-like enzyme
MYPRFATTVFLLVMLSGSESGRADDNADRIRRPNIVFVMVDDMGYGDLPCYGAVDVKTPHIDRLAKQGVRLNQYYAAGTECTPTRTALMSGLYPQRIGGLECAIGTGNVGRYNDAIRLRESHDLGLPAEQAVLGSALKAAGYTTAVFGKWHLGYEPKHHPFNFGFDQFFGFLGGYVDYFRHRELSDLDVLYDGKQPVVQQGYMTHLITDRAVGFLREQKQDRPFFLYVPYSVPHFPFQPPDDDPGTMVTKDNLMQGTRANYVKMLQDMDAAVGKIVAELKAAGLTDNTLLVFASDHGAMKPGSNAPFRGFKGGTFEGGIRTACLLKWPGKLPAGIVSDQPTITMDLTVSFLNAAGAKTENTLDGIDIVDHLVKQKPIADRTLAWRAKRGSRVWRAVRDGNWKHVTRLEDGVNESWLFNLKTDPAETTDVSSQNGAKLDHLKSLLANWELDVKPER